LSEKPIIAIVDDDQSVREQVADLVNAMGFMAKAFASAGDFLEFHETAFAACLITDIMMPGVSGLELLEQLSASGKTVPAIVVTASTRDADRTRARRSGVVCYLSKPFRERDLLNCIQRAVHMAQVGETLQTRRDSDAREK
jgi:FixJ family two-component response regulator